MRVTVAIAAIFGTAGAASAFDAGGFALQQHQHQLLRQQTAPNNDPEERPSRPGARKKQQMQAEIRALQAQHKRELLPEYKRRVKAQGKQAADAWLRREAERRGREAALHIKRKYGAN